MFTKIILTTALATLSMAAMAQQTKSARSNDVATKYELAADKTFYRYVNGNKCAITTKVDSFKVSEHPNDVAMIYFRKEGNLFYLKNAPAAESKCPKAETKVLVKGIKKDTVVSSLNSQIVNLTLDTAGKFLGWGNTKLIVSLDGVQDYVNNECYNVKGKSHSSYVAFALTYGKQVYKIKGNSKDDKAEAGTWSSLAQFKATNKVCQVQ